MKPLLCLFPSSVQELEVLPDTRAHTDSFGRGGLCPGWKQSESLDQKPEAKGSQLGHTPAGHQALGWRQSAHILHCHPLRVTPTLQTWKQTHKGSVTARGYTAGSDFPGAQAQVCLSPPSLSVRGPLVGGLRRTCEVYCSSVFLRTNGKWTSKLKTNCTSSPNICFETASPSVLWHPITNHPTPRGTGMTLEHAFGDFKNELCSFLKQSHPPASSQK